MFDRDSVCTDDVELKGGDIQALVFFMCTGLIRMSSVIEKLVENFLQDLGEIDADEADTKTQDRDKKK